MTDATNEAAATFAAETEKNPDKPRQGMVFPRPMSIEALFAIEQLAMLEETHEILMRGALGTALSLRVWGLLRGIPSRAARCRG